MNTAITIVYVLRNIIINPFLLAFVSRMAGVVYGTWFGGRPQVHISGDKIIGQEIRCEKKFVYKGVPLEDFIQLSSVGGDTSPLFTAPGMHMSDFCATLCQHYFGTLPFKDQLVQILTSWFDQQTGFLSDVLKMDKAKCIHVLLTLLPESKILLDGPLCQDKLNAKLAFLNIADNEEVGRIAIGAYGCLESVLHVFISCDDDTYSRILVRKICSILYGMRNDFPQSMIIDKI